MNKNKYDDVIRNRIIQDLAEGVMTLDFSGTITYFNPAAENLLNYRAEDVIGKPFARCFFVEPANDEFNQCILDVIYTKKKRMENIVSYTTGITVRQLHIATSHLHIDGKRVGIIVVLSDVSELLQLRDSVKMMRRIQELNESLQERNTLISRTFGRFLSDDIVHQLLETPDGLALGGKKRVLTVMMSDLRGFTALSERMEAQDLVSMLNHYLGAMTEIIQSYGGTIIEFIGDGIMAMFDPTYATEKHAEKAVAAALRMEAEMRSVNTWNAAYGYPSLEMGIGIHTGSMIVGNIGSEKRTKYGVVGKDVNLCGRIESYTVGGQVLISENTRAIISAPLETDMQYSVFPKGADTPMTLHSVTGIGEPYAIRYVRREDPLKPLDAPPEMSFFIIKDKHQDMKPCFGTLTALSETGAEMVTDEPIKAFDNLQLECGTRIFCKVLGKSERGWILRFTALPTGFDRWYAQTMARK